MVYLDAPAHRLGRMVMCHMIADTSEELHTMATRLGLKRRWCQEEGSPREHYDLCKEKRLLAISFGGLPVTRRRMGELIHRRVFEAALQAGAEG